MMDTTELKNISNELHHVRNDVTEIKTNLTHHEKNLTGYKERIDKVEDKMGVVEKEIVSLRAFGNDIQRLNDSVDIISTNTQSMLRRLGKTSGIVDGGVKLGWVLFGILGTAFVTFVFTAFVFGINGFKAHG